MTIEALKYVGDVLIDAGIHYEFGEFSATPLPESYFVGDFMGIEPMNEDGMDHTTMMVTGTSLSWLELMEAKKTIEGLFPSVGGRVAMLENGSAVAIFFDSALDIPTDTANLKRIQINLTVKEWKVQ